MVVKIEEEKNMRKKIYTSFVHKIIFCANASAQRVSWVIVDVSLNFSV